MLMSQILANLNKVLGEIPQIEYENKTDEIHLSKTQLMILDFLKTQNHPILPRMISRRIGLNYNSVRARLYELCLMGYVYQPNKTNLFDGKRCGYMIAN